MRMGLVVVGLLGVALCSGCASTVNKVDVNKGLDSYYHQQQVVQRHVVTIPGASGP